MLRFSTIEQEILEWFIEYFFTNGFQYPTIIILNIITMRLTQITKNDLIRHAIPSYHNRSDFP